MTHILIHDYGGPDVLQLSERTIQRPGKGQVVVDISAAGVNLLDVWVREGQYLISPLPLVPGVEGMGRISIVGSYVEELELGDRVAWCFVPGSYSRQLLAPVSALVKVPDSITDHVAAAIMMEGLTAYHFATKVYPIKAGDIALVHSATTGFGLLLTQMIQLLGGTVIGIESDMGKEKIGQTIGADYVVGMKEAGFVDEVMALTGGLGVNVVYDGVGLDALHDSLASLRRHGVLACFGQSINHLPQRKLRTPVSRSVLITYPTTGIPVTSREALLAQSALLFDWVSKGKLKVNIGHTYSLEEASHAHRDIESGRITDKLLLVP